MKQKIFILLIAGAVLAACEKEKGVGFTGIGPASQAAHSAYALDFVGLSEAAPVGHVSGATRP